MSLHSFKYSSIYCINVILHHSFYSEDQIRRRDSARWYDRVFRPGSWLADRRIALSRNYIIIIIIIIMEKVSRVNLRDIHVRGTVDYIPPLTIEHGATGLASSMKTTNLLQAAGLGAHSSEVSKRLDDLLDEDPSMQSRRGHLETLELQKAGV